MRSKAIAMALIWAMAVPVSGAPSRSKVKVVLDQLDAIEVKIERLQSTIDRIQSDRMSERATIKSHSDCLDACDKAYPWIDEIKVWADQPRSQCSLKCNRLYPTPPEYSGGC